MAPADLDDLDIASAERIMALAGVLPIVLEGLAPRGFTIEQFLSHCKTPPALVRARHAIWLRCYEVRTPSGKREYSLPELGRYFNRDDTSIGYVTRKVGKHAQ